MLSETGDDHYSPTVRLLDVERNELGNCGFHLTRSKWDPYPWVSVVDQGSAAETAGVKIGDCVIEVNGEDIVGKRITEVANLVKMNANVSLLLWNVGVDPQCSPETLCCGPMPRNLQRLTACMSSILGVLECPICLDTIPPPCYQCDNGHLICMRCRAKSERCPVCRVRFNRGRSLLADQIYNSVTDAFDLKEETEEGRNAKMQQIFKLQSKNRKVPGIKITQAHTSKFLAKLVGKSSSVDNLSSKNASSSTLSLDGALDASSKTKSLSSNEIFDSSPIISRSSSMMRLNVRPGRDRLSIDRPNSCHGSYESLNSKMNDFEREETNRNVACPFSIECCVPAINESKLFDHFQEFHNGPLIQYFKPSITLNLGNILTHNTYVITTDQATFFVKILKNLDELEENVRDIHLWCWCSGEGNVCDSYQMISRVYNSSNYELLKVHNSVYRLNTTSWDEVLDRRKGVVISGGVFTSDAQFNIYLEIKLESNCKK